MLQNCQQGLQGSVLIFFFFEAAGKDSNSNAVLSLPLVLLLQRQLAASFQVQSPAEHNVPGEAAKEDSLRDLIPSGIMVLVVLC